MKTEIFLDTDVILDLVFEREPFAADALKIFNLIEKNQLQGFTSSLILANCHYIVSNNMNRSVAAKTIAKLRALLTVLPFTDKEIGEALNSNMKDFEDGVQYFIAVNNGLETIITRNVADYKNVAVNVFLPADYLTLEQVKKHF